MRRGDRIAGILPAWEWEDFMDLGLKHKVALVAGSSRGLGKAVALELARQGASVFLIARGREKLEQTRREIAEATGSAVEALAADLSVPGAAREIAAAALRDLGRVDILVNNAGGPPAGRFEDLSPRQWEAAYHLTLRSALDLTREVLPGMKERRWGRILNITSISVKQPVPNLILSNSLRAAVTGFARTLADEVASFGITVNCILPGYTRTRRLDELAEKNAALQRTEPDAVRAVWESQIPMGRLGEPRELAALAAFLASERASYITATSIPVDGGWIKALY